jgi:hypothetical protein
MDMFRREKFSFVGMFKKAGNKGESAIDLRMDGYDLPYGSGGQYDVGDVRRPTGYRVKDHGTGKENKWCAKTCAGDSTCGGYELNSELKHCKTHHDVPGEPTLQAFEDQTGASVYYRLTDADTAVASIKKKEAEPTVTKAIVYLIYGKHDEKGGPSGTCRDHLPSSQGNVLKYHPEVQFGIKTAKMSYHTADCGNRKTSYEKKFADGTPYTYFNPNASMSHGLRISSGYTIVDKPMKMSKFEMNNISIRFGPEKSDALITGVVIDIYFAEDVILPPKRMVGLGVMDDGWQTSHGISGTNGTMKGKAVTVYIAANQITGDNTNAHNYNSNEGPHRWLAKNESDSSNLLFVSPKAKTLYNTAKIRSAMDPLVNVKAKMQKSTKSYDMTTGKDGEDWRRDKPWRGCFNSMHLGVAGSLHSSAKGGSGFNETYDKKDKFGDWQITADRNAACIIPNDSNLKGVRPGGSGSSAGAACPGNPVFWQWNSKKEGILDCWYSPYDLADIKKHKSALVSTGLNGSNVYTQLIGAYCQLPGNSTKEYDTNLKCNKYAGEQLLQDCIKDPGKDWMSCSSLLDDDTLKASFKTGLQKYCTANPTSKVCGCFNAFRGAGAFCQIETNVDLPGCKNVNEAVSAYEEMIAALEKEALEAGVNATANVIAKLKDLVTGTRAKPGCYAGVCLDGQKEWMYNKDTGVECPAQNICIQNMNVTGLQAVASNVTIESSCDVTNDAGDEITDDPPPADETKKSADETKKSADETNNSADETKKSADETKKSADETKKSADETTPTVAPTPKKSNLLRMIGFGFVAIMILLMMSKKKGAAAAPATGAMQSQMMTPQQMTAPSQPMYYGPQYM